jgi:hypothetical protein
VSVTLPFVIPPAPACRGSEAEGSAVLSARPRPLLEEVFKGLLACGLPKERKSAED